PALLLAAVATLQVMSPDSIRNFYTALFQGVDPAYPDETGWDVFKHRIPFLAYLGAMTALVVVGFRKNYSLVPVLGAASTGYLMTELGWVNWVRFGIWLAVGLA